MLPKEFLKRMENLLVRDMEDFLNSYKNNPVKSFFVNQNKISSSDFEAICPWQIQKSHYGYKLLDDIKVGKSPEHHAGMIYMQEFSAMMPVSFLPLNGDECVLDMCASPGGKSIQLANRLKNGFLLSNEVVKARAGILQSNVERMGLTNVCISNCDPKELAQYLSGVFDAVVVDAPCSGEGMFRKDIQAVQAWSPEHVRACADRQLAILDSADRCLKQNGYLLYSTCSFSLEENEGVVAKFCSKHNYKIIPLQYNGAVSGEKVEGFNTDYALRFYPHKFEGEGQFVALLQKCEDSQCNIKTKNRLLGLSKAKKEYSILEQFLKENLTEFNDILHNSIIKDDIVYFVPNIEIAQSGIKLVNAGVKLGEMLKQRFEPSHQFAMCFGTRFKNKVDLNVTEAEQYLKGEVIRAEGKGFATVLYNGVTLGLGKISGGIMKNHYPKGLRNN